MNEIWKLIPGSTNTSVSNMGRIKGPTGICKCSLNKTGYKFKKVKIDGKIFSFAVHRAVMLAFHGPSILEVNHKNGIKTDNRLENLEYVTREENIAHAYRTGLNRPHLGENHPRAKLTKADVLEIRELLSAGGLRQVDIAKRFGVSVKTINHIHHRRLWKSV